MHFSSDNVVKARYLENISNWEKTRNIVTTLHFINYEELAVLS